MVRSQWFTAFPFVSYSVYLVYLILNKILIPTGTDLCKQTGGQLTLSHNYPFCVPEFKKND
jgi:hypothetical protein